MVVALATRTWMVEDPGTMVATVVVVELGAVVGGDVVLVEDSDAVATPNGARVAEGRTSTPITTATATTPTPRSQPEGGGDPGTS